MVDTIIMKRQYMERHNAAQDTDPLLFWKVNTNDFEPMLELSKKYLCIPASSVESERTFSTAGQIVSDRRSRIKPKNVDMLVFINKNQWLIDQQ
uniref:Zinc finger BED domain-containing protein 1-like n=1 Tax=Diabrotica virgifera virgifera TaxID=50390 RepID=A0A6P7FJL1_DIAVI